MNSIELVDYDPAFLDLSWNWLNDPEIRSLTNTPEFTREGQRTWYESLPGNTAYKVWGICCDQQRIGVVGLKHIHDGTGEYFVYIGDKSYWGKGLGSRIMTLTIGKALELGLHELTLSVLRDNLRAFRSYEKDGFAASGSDEHKIYMKRQIA